MLHCATENEMMKKKKRIGRLVGWSVVKKKEMEKQQHKAIQANIVCLNRKN